MNIKKQQGTTLIQRACANVKEFNALHKRLEKKTIVRAKSVDTLINYMRYNPDACPVCRKLTMVTVFNFDRRGPPDAAMIRNIIAKHFQYQAS